MNGRVSADEREKGEQEIQARTRQKIDNVISLLAAKEGARVFEAPSQSFSGGNGPGTYEYGMRATVIFPLAFDGSRLKLYEQQLRPGATLDFLNEELPEEPSFVRPTSFTMTVASPEAWSKELEKRIRKASPAVRNVTVVPSRRIDK